jgi:hypothetical protein
LGYRSVAAAQTAIVVDEHRDTARPLDESGELSLLDRMSGFEATLLADARESALRDG